MWLVLWYFSLSIELVYRACLGSIHVYAHSLDSLVLCCYAKKQESPVEVEGQEIEMPIQVFGTQEFSENAWRNALQYFFRSIWSGESIFRPYISLNGWGIQIMLPPGGMQELSNGKKTIPDSYGLRPSPWAFKQTPTSVRPDQVLETGTSGAEFEASVMRFIANDKVLHLVINGCEVEQVFNEDETEFLGFRAVKPVQLTLWKHPGRRDRGFLGVSAKRL